MIKYIVNFFTNIKIINNAIVFNSIIIFILLFDNIPSFIFNFLFIIDIILNIYFSIEIVFNLLKEKRKFFKKITNILDLILLILVIYLLWNGDFYQANSVYAIRFLRLIKCVKLFKMIPNYDKIIKNIRIICKTCVSMFLILFIIIFVLSMLLTILFSNTSPEYFENPLISTYTLFRLLTTEGWYDIPNAISTNYTDILSFIIKFLFCGIVIVGIFGMSFLTSMVTDELASDNNDEVMKKLVEIEKEIKKIKNN